MIAVVTVLSAFALGYFMRSRLAANTTYAVAYLWAFTYQTLYLILDSFGGTSDAPAWRAGADLSPAQRWICWSEGRSSTRPRLRSPARTRLPSRSSRSRAIWLERSW